MDIERINDEIEFLNYKYQYNDKYGLSPKDEDKKFFRNYFVVPGTIPVLLSAPHAVKQYRKKRKKKIEKGKTKDKEADDYTGAIVEFLCKETGAWGIIRNWYAKDDPNFNKGHRSESYRKEIIRLINAYGIDFLLDIHGFDENRHPELREKELVVGTGNGKNINPSTQQNQLIKEIFQDKVAFDDPFSATKEYNVSAYTHKNTNEKITCYQMELNNRSRFPGERRIILLKELKQLILELEPTKEAPKKYHR